MEDYNKLNVKSNHVQCRCNTAIKELSMWKLKELGYTPSQAYSRFRQTYSIMIQDADGNEKFKTFNKGLISKFDKETQAIAQGLVNHIMRFNYSFHVDRKLADDMAVIKGQYLEQLVSYMDKIEHGITPKYYSDSLGLDSNSKEGRAWEQAILKEIILHETDFDDNLKDFLTDPFYSKDDIKRLARLTNIQINEIVTKIDDSSIFDRLHKRVTDSIEYYNSHKKESDKPADIKAQSILPYLDRWSIRVDFSGKKSESDWMRNHLEFIQDIPNITTEQDRISILHDIDVMSDFDIKRRQLKEREAVLYRIYKSDNCDFIKVKSDYRQLYADAIALAMSVVNSLNFVHPLKDDNDLNQKPLFGEPDYYASRLKEPMQRSYAI